MKSSGQRSIEVEKRCPLCDGWDSHLFDRRDFRGQPVTNWLCAQCGCVYQYPRLGEEALNTFYKREYRQLYQGNEGPSSKDLVVQEERAAGLLDFLQRHGAQFSRHLDIGSSAGILLKQFHVALATHEVGIEPGEAYRKYAQALGMTTYASLEELDLAGETQFDLISLVHVLEHLPDPIDYLRNLRQRNLAATGWLLVEVPNLYAHDCFEVAHLVSFSEHSLRQTVSRAGFVVMSLEKHGWPRSKSIPLYLTVLAQPAQATEQVTTLQWTKENGVKWRRRTGLFRRRLIERFFPSQAWKLASQ